MISIRHWGKMLSVAGAQAPETVWRPPPSAPEPFAAQRSSLEALLKHWMALEVRRRDWITQEHRLLQHLAFCSPNRKATAIKQNKHSILTVLSGNKSTKNKQEFFLASSPSEEWVFSNSVWKGRGEEYVCLNENNFLVYSFPALQRKSIIKE